MTYEWKCRECGQRQEVFRTSMRFSQLAPDSCPRRGCTSTSFVRGVERPARLARDSGRETGEWPLVADHLGKRSLDVRDDGISQTPDGHLVFKTEASYLSWLDRHDMVRTSDLYDTGVGIEESSQHSFDDRYDPPPSERAVEMAKEMKFLTSEDVKEEFGVDPAPLFNNETSDAQVLPV